MNALSIKRDRNSNLELLRIVAMLLVLVVHADFFSISEPTKDEIILSPFLSFFRYFIESCAIVCVNVFVLLSGWFGIKPKIRRFLDFSFQVVFFSSILYFVTGSYHRSLGEWLTILLGFQYWFVKAYIVLYALAPILNAFIDNSSKKQLEIFLISFYVVQTIYGCYLGNANWFNKGYSPLSFIGLYILARYIRLYKPFAYSIHKWALLYFLCALIISFCGMLGVRMGYDVVLYVYAYDSPPVVLASVCFFMIFAEMKLSTNSFINTIAISSFAVYLFHYHECILHNYYTDIIYNWYTTKSFGEFLLYALGWIVLVFMISILIDKVRLAIWKVLLIGCNSMLRKDD